MTLAQLHDKLVALGIPVLSVRYGTPPVVVYAATATPAQVQQGNSLAASADLRARVPRTLLDIRADLVALTTAQKNAVWSDLTSGSPPRWSKDSGPNAAALAVLTLLGASGTLSAADVLEAKLRGVAMYTQDNPSYLVNPAFDATINIAGDQLA